MIPTALKQRLQRFESTWDDSASERFEEFLSGVNEQDRSEMLSELIMIDLERWIRSGKNAAEVEEIMVAYRNQFPQLFENATLAAKIREHRLRSHGLIHSSPESTMSGKPAATHLGNGAKLASGLSLPCDFGDLRLLRIIGRGGMGIVYEAEQKTPHRVVAVKVLSGDVSVDAEAVSRFERETELIASIDDPGVVPVLESGYVAGRRFYTMPLYRGGTLRDRMQNDNLTIQAAAQILLQVTHSVSSVHRVQIVHRDLKPGNILFSEDGAPRIADFGLSRHVDHSRSITRTGEIYGTPGYIAPERIAGNNKQINDFISDVYSLGAILYDMLCGRPPFRGATAWETLSQARSDSPVPPARLNPKVDKDLNAICMKCLELKPKDRYSTCVELAGDLENYLAGRPVSAKPPSPLARVGRFARRHPAKAGLAVSTLGMLLIGIVATFLFIKLSIQEDKLELESERRRNESYIANLASAAQLMAGRSMGWRGSAESYLTTAALDPPAGHDVSQLRSMSATLAVQPDLEPIATLAAGMWCDTACFDSSGTWLALGQNKDTDGFVVLIYRTDQLEAEPYRLWVDCKDENDRRRQTNHSKAEDGARAIAFSQDGKATCDWHATRTSSSVSLDGKTSRVDGNLRSRSRCRSLESAFFCRRKHTLDAIGRRQAKSRPRECHRNGTVRRGHGRFRDGVISDGERRVYSNARDSRIAPS